MKKLALFIIVLLSVKLNAQDALSITHNLPTALNPGSVYDAEFTINKGGISSFAKFQCDVPFGVSVANIESKGGNFTFENNRIKIVWVSVPSEPSFTIKMKFTFPNNAINNCNLAAKFFYLESNVKKEYEMPVHNIKIGEGSGTVTTPTNTVTTTPTNTVTTSPTNTVTTTPTNTVTTTPTNTVTTTPTNTVTTTPTNTVTTTPTNTVTTTPTNTVTTTPSADGKIFRVQLGSFNETPSKNKFPGVQFIVLQEGGYYKAQSGNFNNLEEAIKHRDALSAKGYNGFIVAYKNGVRTTVTK